MLQNWRGLKAWPKTSVEHRRKGDAMHDREYRIPELCQSQEWLLAMDPASRAIRNCMVETG
ncbi:hypothetical protein MPLSOD_270093 [Mesorhizobium sp. SOD10]|nr:hypothetical protein MPLSOD_270093 [Mesorhizobium sp. SOD10]